MINQQCLVLRERKHFNILNYTNTRYINIPTYTLCIIRLFYLPFLCSYVYYILYTCYNIYFIYILLYLLLNILLYKFVYSAVRKYTVTRCLNYCILSVILCDFAVLCSFFKLSPCLLLFS